MAQRVLIVEDEQHLAEGLRFNLEAEGYERGSRRHRRARAGAAARSGGALRSGRARRDAAGHRRLRASSPSCGSAQQFVPVLMLTARGRPEDVLKGFAAGADDYLPKPSELAILLARVGGLLRRSSWSRARAGRSRTRRPLHLQRPDHRFRHARADRRRPRAQAHADGGEPARYLIEHEGKAVSRKAMLEHVWGLREDTDTRAIDNFVVRLRRYLEEEPARPQHLLTVRGVGYRFVANPMKMGHCMIAAFVLWAAWRPATGHARPAWSWTPTGAPVHGAVVTDVERRRHDHDDQRADGTWSVAVPAAARRRRSRIAAPGFARPSASGEVAGRAAFASSCSRSASPNGST